MTKFWDAIKKADANYSAASWIPAILQYVFPFAFAAIAGWLSTSRDWLWANYGMLGALSIGLTVLFVSSLSLYIAGKGVTVWRGLLEARTVRETTPQKTQETKCISTVRLVPSGNEMSLVVTPARGNVTINMFVDLSYWRPSLIPSDWSQPERLYLGDAQLRAANVKFSIAVMEKEASTGVGWLWKILKSDGEPSGTKPWLVHGRLRVTFIFMDPAGNEEKFPMLLVQPTSDAQHPVVFTPSDLPAIA